MTAASDVMVRCTNLVHVYGASGAEVAALRGVDLEIGSGEMVALLGPSGSGKSTLLWHLAGLLQPTAGSVEVAGASVAAMSPAARAQLRLRTVGVVLQRPARNLLGHLTCVENVAQVQRPTHLGGRARRARAHELLESVGLAALAGRTAQKLSGGEQQRLAVAVALANRPALLLADEPTSHLDPDSTQAVLELMRTANAELGTTVVAVTHDPTVGVALGRTLTIRDGLIGATTVAGGDYIVVRRGGSIQLPTELLDVLPPGTLVRARSDPRGVLLERAVQPGAVQPGDTDTP